MVRFIYFYSKLDNSVYSLNRDFCGIPVETTTTPTPTPETTPTPTPETTPTPTAETTPTPTPTP